MGQNQNLLQEFRQRRERFLYYIIALCIASIGFSVHITTGQGLSWIKMPLGIAVLSWATSVFFGLSTLRLANWDLVWEDIAATEGTKAREAIRARRDQKTSWIIRLSRWQEILFYLGVIMFVIWHILEMAEVTPK